MASQYYVSTWSWFARFFCCIFSFFPRIFVRGSCFWLCTPVRVRPASSSRPVSSHTITHTPLSHTTLTHTTYSHTHNLLTRSTTYSHTHTTQLIHTHTSLSHTKLSLTPTSTFTLCGRRCTYGTRLALVARLVPGDAVPFCVAGVALGHLVTAARLVLADAAPYCVASVALGDIHLHFVWQARHLVTSTFILCGGFGICGTGLALVARLVPVTPLHFVWRAWTWSHLSPLCVAGVALGDIGLHFCVEPRHFVWQAWRRGTCVWQAWHLRHGAGSGGALGDIGLHTLHLHTRTALSRITLSVTLLWHTYTSVTHLSHAKHLFTCNFFTYHSVTHSSFTELIHTHGIVTHDSFTHNIVTHSSFTHM